MKVGLYNLQPRVTNLALEKIRTYYKCHHHIVEDCLPLEAQQYDVVYCSSIFDWANQKYVSPSMLVGGTGFDLTTVLPPEIDAVEPHINRGYTSRGCPHNCPFCVVREKEGGFRIVGDILKLWDGRSRLVTCLDNNVLASPEHFARNAEQAREHKIMLDYNQGLDHRFLTPDIVDVMLSFSHAEYRFAFDHPNLMKSVDTAITLLQSKGVNRCSWYVLVGFDTTMEQDLFRLNYLRERNQIAYVQRFRKKGLKQSPETKHRLVALARWTNQHHLFRAMSWRQFLEHPDNRAYRDLLVEDGEKVQSLA